MFDFRYHVVSLAAVFLALVIGILVGIGLSGRGVIDDAERENLNEQIAELRGERDQARDQIGAAARRHAAMEDFAAGTYPALVGGRLAGANVAVVAVGPVDGSTEAIEKAVRDGGGRVVRLRSIRVPLDRDAVVEALSGDAQVQARYDERGELDDLGRDLARELAAGGKTPLWDALSDVLVEQRDGWERCRPTRSWSLEASRRNAARRRTSSPASTAALREPTCRCRGPAGRARGSVRAGVREERALHGGQHRHGCGEAGPRAPARGRRPGTLRRGGHGHRRRPASALAVRRDRMSVRVVLVAARDEEARIAATVTRLRNDFPEAEIVVADDGSRDGTAAAAEAAGARVERLPRLGKGQALTLAERGLPPGPLLVCDADVEGDLRPLAESAADLSIGVFAERLGGGFGIAKRSRGR